MKNLALLSIFLALPLAAQTTPVAPVTDVGTVITTIFGTPVPAGLPTQVVGLGIGHVNGTTTGIVSGAISITPGSYAVSELVTQAGTTAARVGVKQYLTGSKSGSFGFLINGTVGVATGATSVGGSFGVGGDAVFHIGTGNKYVDIGAEFAKSDISTFTSSAITPASLHALASKVEIRVEILGKLK